MAQRCKARLSMFGREKKETSREREREERRRREKRKKPSYVWYLRDPRLDPDPGRGDSGRDTSEVEPRKGLLKPWNI